MQVRLPKIEDRLLRKALIGTSIGALGLFCLSLFSDLAPWIRSNIERPIEFYARSRVFNNIKTLDPRIKVLVYDDQITGYLKRPQLNAREWTNLVRSISAAQPRAIIIDQIFAFDSAVPGSEKEISDFSAALKESGVVYAGAMLTSQQTPARHLVPTSKLQRIRTNQSSSSFENISDRSDSMIAYGPSASIVDSFAGVGHIAYRADGEVTLRQRIQSNYEIKHLMLEALQEPGPIESDLPIDYIDHATFNSSLRSLLPFVKISESNGVPTTIQTGDVVVIVLNFYTGAADVDHSPIGRIFRAHAWVSLLNSLLQNKVISDQGNISMLSMIASIMGGAIGIIATGLAFWALLAANIMVWVFLGIFSFSAFYATFSWAFPTICGLLVGLSAYAIRSRFSEQKMEILKKTLKGTVPELQLSKYLQNPNLVTMDSNEQILTLMFVDIAGFSHIAERSSPRAMFERLQDILGTLTKIVHKHGGSVDKTLGDGLFCFFGYSLDGQTAVSNQADAAINCAIEMQRESLKWNLANVSEQKPVFPIRIGINTANVFVGYLGNEDRYDFTIIGNGVNFAQRLESACEPMSVLMSSTTLDFSSNYSQSSDAIKTKRIKIKHHSELFSAVEIDPLATDEAQRAVVVEVFRKQQNLDRKEQRWPFEATNQVQIESSHGTAKLRDFSISGGCMLLPMYLARGIQFEIRLNSADGELSRKLMERGIDDILVEICWSRPSESGFAHGFRILNLNRQQNHFIFQSLREILPAQRYKGPSVKKIS